MSTVAGLIDNNPRFRQDDLLVSGDSIKGDGTLDNELFDGAGKANLATGFGEACRAKNTPFGQSNGMITEASSAVTKSDD